MFYPGAGPGARGARPNATAAAAFPPMCDSTCWASADAASNDHKVSVSSIWHCEFLLAGYSLAAHQHSNDHFDTQDCSRHICMQPRQDLTKASLNRFCCSKPKKSNCAAFPFLHTNLQPSHISPSRSRLIRASMAASTCSLAKWSWQKFIFCYLPSAGILAAQEEAGASGKAAMKLGPRGRSAPSGTIKRNKNDQRIQGTSANRPKFSHLKNFWQYLPASSSRGADLIFEGVLTRHMSDSCTCSTWQSVENLHCAALRLVLLPHLAEPHLGRLHWVLPKSHSTKDARSHRLGLDVAEATNGRRIPNPMLEYSPFGANWVGSSAVVPVHVLEAQVAAHVPQLHPVVAKHHLWSNVKYPASELTCCQASSRNQQNISESPLATLAHVKTGWGLHSTSKSELVHLFTSRLAMLNLCDVPREQPCTWCN